MTRDISNKLSKHEYIKSSKTDLKKKRNKDSDSDNGNESDSENDEIDIHEFRKYVQKIFPSKHLDKKIKAGEKLKKVYKDYDTSDEEKDYVKKSSKKDKFKKNKVIEKEEEEIWETDSSGEEEKNSKKSKSKNKKVKDNGVGDDETLSLDSKESDDYDNDDENYDDYDENYDDYDENTLKGKSGKVNIIFTIGGIDDEYDEDYDDEYDDEYDEDYDDNETEDEDESVSSNDSYDNGSDDNSNEDYKEEKSKTKNKIKKNVIDKKNSNKDKKINNEDKKISNDDTKMLIKNKKGKDNGVGEDENKDNDKIEVLSQLKELLQKNPKDKSIEKCIKVYEENLKCEKKKKEKKEKKQKAKNLRIFKKILRDKNSMNDFTFYEKLETENQKKLIKELREINKITRIEKPYRMTLLESNIPIHFKAAAMKKINLLRYMESGSGEFYKIKNWVDTFMKIPFTNYQSLPISIENGIESCHNFMENAQKTLDEAVYGLNDAKMQIMQMLGQLLTNPKTIGTAIAIHGPPGTGKTSLVKEGISKILNRPFAFIALGGATDSSFLEGHGYTYEGSTWGKIVQILIDSKCMNPIIYFDELDKISDTPRGEEITSILTHLTDTTQNSEFHDKYFTEINFDLSKCLFIFSYNDESKVNSILKDRMYRIKTKGYSGKEKTVIANNYLLPKIREQIKFNEENIIIPDDVLGYIIENYCNKEDGVRNMKRCLEIIYTKINLYRLMKPGTNLFECEMSLKVEFPFTITKQIIDKLIKKESDGLETWRTLYT